VVMRAPARGQPRARLVLEAAPILAEGFDQLGAEHDVAVLAALAAKDVNHHAFGAISVTLSRVTSARPNRSHNRLISTAR